MVCLATWTLSTALLLADLASAKAISFPVLSPRSSDGLEQAMRRAVSAFETDLERRDSSPATSMPTGNSNTTVNTSVASACDTAVSAMTTVSNPAGFAGCYNILQWDPSTEAFRADLRLYQQHAPTDDFADIPANEVTVGLNYPDSTLFQLMMKRGTTDLVKREGSVMQIQQYSLSGSFKQRLDVTKLNQTSLASLMVPQITLQVTSPQSQKVVTTNMTAADSAWFVAGEMTNISAEAATVANPATASAAITASTPFVLPGQTLGIFPTGLIVTSVWTLLFFLAFGLGTGGRIKSRDLYRKRVMGLASRARR